MAKKDVLLDTYTIKNELALSETQIEEGETKDARQSLRNLRDKYVL